MVFSFAFSIEWIPVLAAFGGTVVAAWWDLRTTEVPDEVFYAMFGIGFVYYFYQSFIAATLWPLLSAVAAAGVLFGIGYAMYKFGQWGGADTFLLTAVGFLLPNLPSTLGFSPQLFFPFPLSYLINVFLVGTPYMLLYATFIAFHDKKVRTAFGNDMKASAKSYLLFAAILFVFFFALSYYLSQQFSIKTTIPDIVRSAFIPVAATLSLFVIFKFSKNVEEIEFKKKIPVSKLKVGDVLEDSVEFVGMSASEVAKIKRSGKKFVVIKEGVRFAPAFPLALLFTLLYGDAIFLLLKYFITF